jgi:hypothetical protein
VTGYETWSPFATRGLRSNELRMWGVLIYSREARALEFNSGGFLERVLSPVVPRINWEGFLSASCKSSSVEVK